MPHQAAAIGRTVFLLRTGTRHDDIHELIDGFKVSLRRWGLETIVENQVQYASRVAAHDDDLIYEEMHKLFSLRDEIHGLVEIGISSTPSSVEQLDALMRHRFQRQRHMAELVAQDCVADWNKSLWWYSENVK